MIKWIRTSKLPIKHSLSRPRVSLYVRLTDAGPKVDESKNGRVLQKWMGVCRKSGKLTSGLLVSFFFFFFFITLGLEISDTKVYEPYIRDLLGTPSQYREAVSRTPD